MERTILKLGALAGVFSAFVIVYVVVKGVFK